MQKVSKGGGVHMYVGRVSTYRRIPRGPLHEPAAAGQPRLLPTLGLSPKYLVIMFSPLGECAHIWGNATIIYKPG